MLQKINITENAASEEVKLLPAPESPAKQAKDPNLESSRALRAINQYKFYTEKHGGKTILESTKGKPAANRWLQSRQSIFPPTQFPYINPIYPVHPLQFSGRRINKLTDSYVRSEHTKKMQLDLFSVIDESCEEIANLHDSKQKSEATFRLASVLYTIGILIHPANDANNQTLKCMVTSYIQDLDAQHRGRYFPIKISQVSKTQKHDIETKFSPVFGSITPEPINPADHEETEMLKLINELKRIQLEYDDITALNKRSTEAVSRFRQTHNVQELEKLLESEGSKDDYRWIQVYIPGAFVQALVRKGHDLDRARFTVTGMSTRMGNVTRAIHTLLDDPEGISSIKKYIITGKASSQGLERLDNVLSIAKEQFDQVGIEIKRIFQDDSISSESAIDKQHSLAVKYLPLAQKLESLPDSHREQLIRSSGDYYNNPKGTAALIEILEGWFKD